MFLSAGSTSAPKTATIHHFTYYTELPLRIFQVRIPSFLSLIIIIASAIGDPTSPDIFKFFLLLNTQQINTT